MPKRDHQKFIDSLTKIVDYLELDESEDYHAHHGDAAYQENHIYTHICNVRKWIQEEVNRGLCVQDALESDSNVERIAKYLVSQFWLGAEIGINNSSVRDMSQEQYYQLNKHEWDIKAECLINEISKEEEAKT